jgi:hypothetical protein
MESVLGIKRALVRRHTSGKPCAREIRQADRILEKSFPEVQWMFDPEELLDRWRLHLGKLRNPNIYEQLDSLKAWIEDWHDANDD